MDELIAKAEEVAAATRAAEEAVAAFAVATDEAAVLLGAAAGRANDFRNAVAGIAAGTMSAEAALTSLDGKLDDLIMLSTATVSELHDLRNAMAGVAVAALAMGSATTAAAGAEDAAAAAGTVAGTRWWTLGLTIGQALHWIIMGTLEIAATAIPAIVALGAAAMAMAPSFAHIADQINYLRIATGSWSGVMANSVGPLQAAGAATIRLRAAVAPDAYIIFGAAINALTGHVGAFSGVAQQASNALAAFATKLSAELQGPMGAQLAGFFQNAVKYMIQWGQVLGNVGHAFIDIFTHMFGVGQLLLDVLDMLSRAFLALVSNSVVGTLIGVAAAMSALYRYGGLLVGIFSKLGPMLAALFIAAFGAIEDLVVLLPVAISESGVLVGTFAALDAVIGPVGWAILAVAAALGAWYLATHQAKSATDTLIASINKVTPTMSNIIPNIGLMGMNLANLTGHLSQASAAMSTSAVAGQKYNTVATQASANTQNLDSQVQASIAEINKLANEYVNLATGLGEASMRTGQVGGAMQALAVQTGLADSKVQALNQAIDQYISLLTGGTSAVAGFATAMSTIGQIAGTTATQTGAATNGMTLSAGEFAKALGNMNTTGAAAWTNLDQVINGSMAPLADWMRQAQTLGAATAPQFSRAMLDMAASVIPYVKGNTTAQNSLLGFMAAQGLVYSSFGKLQSAAGSQSGAISNLTGIVDGATNAMSNLSQMAKNAASALSSQVSSGIAKAALASTTYNKDLLQLQHDMANHAPAAVIEADSQRIAQDVQTAGQRAITAGNNIYSGLTHGGAGAQSAEGKVLALQRVIDGLHGKTITIQVITAYTSTGSPSAYYAGSYGQQRVHPASGGYITGPGTKTSDSIPAMLSNGEFVMRADAVEHYGRNLMHAMNAKQLAAGGSVQPSPGIRSYGPASAGGGGMSQLNLNQTVQLRLDNSVIAAQQRRETLIYYRRNTGNNLALRTR